MKKQLLSVLALCAVTISICRAQAQVPTFWATCTNGGTGSKGTFFKLNTQGLEYDVHNCVTNNNSYPISTFMMASSGVLYCTTNEGTGDSGTLFSYNPSTSIETNLYSFGGTQFHGYYPRGAMVQVTDSMLYGTTTAGGTYSPGGVIYSFDINTNVQTMLHAFGSGGDGNTPIWSLLNVGDSVLYGLASQGGYGFGTIYKYNIAKNKYTSIYEFQGSQLGQSPTGSLILVGDTVLYGMTPAGGTNNVGTIFKYSLINQQLTVGYSFATTNDGQAPTGSLVLATNGLLYGLTSLGGANLDGTIFSYNPSTGVETDIHDFGNNNDGYQPDKSLVQAINGSLYGTTQLGGATNQGAFFGYDVATSTYSLIHSFNNTYGEFPEGDLLEVDTVSSGINQLSVTNNQLTVYPNPSSNFIYVSLTQQQTQPIQLSLYNILGQEVWNTPTQPSTNANPTATIPVTNLPDGVYILKANCGGVVQEKEVAVAR